MDSFASSDVSTGFFTRRDAGGLLTLLALSLLTALIPWLVNADIAISSSLSLLALGFPVAALGSTTRDGDDEADDPPWTGLWMPARPEPRPEEIVIVGAGFSGTMLAVQLAKAGGPRIILVERRDLPAQGAAYSTGHPNHLLNVRAAKMSALPDDPAHFARWLTERRLGGPFDFAPRRSYGAYLDELLAGARAVAGERLTVVTGEAVDIASDGARSAVVLRDGRRLAADRIVLAAGNLTPRDLPALAEAALPSDLYLRDPWSAEAAAGLGRDDKVLLLGTGLSMIDTVVALTDAGFEGKIIATSRRGLLPHVHAEAPAPSLPASYAPAMPVSRLLCAVRGRAERIGWRAAVDELRPATRQLWRGASAEERARFLRHLRPFWDIHRHRIAPAIADRIDGLRATGRLQILAGTIRRVERCDAGARVALRLRGTGYSIGLDVARIVNCIGPNGDIRQADEPLLRNLLAKGAIRPDPQRLGVDVTADGEAIGADGLPSGCLFAIGPIARGHAWEMTAVPELRVQAAAMARLLEARQRAVVHA